MTTSISAGKKIYSLLKNNSQLSLLVKTKIYPIIAEEKTEDNLPVDYPYIVFRKDTVNVFYTKTRCAYDLISYSITTVAKNYFEACNICEIIRSILENYHDELILLSLIISISEEYNEGAYILTIMFDIHISPIE